MSIFFLIYLIIYFRLHWVFVAAHGLSLVAVCKLLLIAVTSLIVEHGFQGLQLQWLQHVTSVIAARRLSSCGMWHPRGPGIELVSPALTGGFLTTEPPGKFMIVSVDAQHF